jgi:DNA-binding CsgD family transcriptional regulator
LSPLESCIRAEINPKPCRFSARGGNMSGVSLLDSRGHVAWASTWLADFPPNACHGAPIWDLSYSQHAERLKTAFAMAAGVKEAQHGIFGLLSPVTKKPVDFEARYEPAPPDIAVVARWRKALAVSILTEQEQDVLLLVCEDLTQKEIASRLGIHETTVGRVRDAIRVKTGARGPAGEVLAAIRMRLIDVPMDEP